MLLGYREWAIAALSALLLASFVMHRPHLFVVLCMPLIGALLWGRLARLARQARRARRAASSRLPSRSRIVISDLRADSLVSLFRPILDISYMERIQDGIEERIKSYILRSGSTENPRVLGVRSVLYGVIAAIIAIPAGVAAFFLYSQALIGIVAVPAILLGFYFVTLKSRESGRRAAIEEELAPFATLAAIMESVNVSLFSTFSMLAAAPPDIFPIMRREARRIRNITELGRSPTGALMDLADSHPSVPFRNLLEGYISSFNTGGSDTAKYLQDQAQRFFRFMQLRMSSYTKQADMIAQVILTVMLLLPMMGLSMVFLSTGTLAATMLLLLIVMFPFITVILIAMVDLKQPKGRDAVKVSWIVFPAGIASAVSIYLIRGEVWEGIGAGVVAGSFLNMLFLGKKFSEISSTEAPLPEFMRQITRFKNIGIDIMHAIKSMRADIVDRRHLAKPPKFNRTFDGMIDMLYRATAAGGSLEQSVSRIGIKSWNARLVFFILGKVHESGGGTAKTLDDITRWVAEYADAKKEMIANLRASLMTAFIGPVLMVMMSVVSDQLSREFEAGYASSGFADRMMSLTPSADIAWLSDTLTITAVVCMGVVLSKINYFTVKHTLFTGIITAFTMALLYAAPYFPDFGP